VAVAESPSVLLALEARLDDCANTAPVTCTELVGQANALYWAVPANSIRKFRVAHMNPGDGGLFTLEVIIYPDAGSIADLGNGLAPNGGSAPVLSGDGLLCSGGSVTLSVSDALPDSLAILVVGVSEINMAYNGGVLVPFPDVILFLTMDGNGAYQLPFLWPAELWIPITLQVWVNDPAGPQGFTATNALRLAGV
jgi:hypothetical protein